ncbi:MAG: hypothetical protein WCP85_07940 [Mariniphaga sp.]
MIRPILLLAITGVSSGLHSKATDQPPRSPNMQFVIRDDQSFPRQFFPDEIQNLHTSTLRMRILGLLNN